MAHDDLAEEIVPMESGGGDHCDGPRGSHCQVRELCIDDDACLVVFV